VGGGRGTSATRLGPCVAGRLQVTVAGEMRAEALISAVLLVLLEAAMSASAAGEVVTYPGPKGEAASKAYAVSAGGKEVFVYRARVRETIEKIPKKLWTHKHGGRTQWASLAYFDFDGNVAVTVRPKRPFKTARVAPASFGVKATVRDGAIRFALDRPRQVTVLLDGRYTHPLHLFANPLEADAPKAGDKNVVYFGPGVHQTGPLRLKSGQTLYVAGGAVVRGTIGPDEAGSLSKRTGLRSYGPLIAIHGQRKVGIRGRGIIDGGLMPHPARTTIHVADSTDVSIEGVIIRDSAAWAVCLSGSEDVTVTNVKQVSGRLNSDGINPVNSRRVRIADCFIRNRDDSIAVKATQPKRPSRDIRAERCVIWNDWGFALGVTYETRAPISDVTFRDCDVIHSEHWALGVHVVDSATVGPVRFEDIRIEHAKGQLIRLNIGKDMWATDKSAGRIKGVVFKDVAYTGPGRPASSITGRDADHRIEDVTFENLRVAGQAVADAKQGRFNVNAHTKNIRFGAK